MKNPFRRLDQLQSDLGRIAVHVTQVQFGHYGTKAGWQPAVNVFRCGDNFFVCVDLAGIEMESLDVRAEARRLIVRGNRAAPEPECEEPVMQVFAIEIDHGEFERVLDLPAEVEPTKVAAEMRQGLLWVRLPLRTHG